MLLQANDYRWLHEHMGCELQAGGSDQWGNITAGIELVRRRAGASVHGLTLPLITRPTARSSARAPTARSGSTPRHVAVRALPVLREPPGRRCRALPAPAHAHARRGGAPIAAEHAAAPERRAGQARLAWEMCALIHGEDAADEAAAASTGFTSAAGALSAEQLAALTDEIPTTQPRSPAATSSTAGRDRARGQQAMPPPDRGGGVRERRRARGEPPARRGDLLHGRYVMLRKGKRHRHLLVTPTPA